jgi:PAS domain S-box-containing protein
MVVEDELIVAEDLTHWLTSLGYIVTARAATAHEAVQLCEGSPPELVLMDILLPGNMDGIQAAEIIRKRFDIPVVYITASSDEATLSRAKVTEPFGYILKPFDERGLYSTIEMALYKHDSERRIRNSEERFRLLYENAPVAFQSLDADGHILGVNKAWQEFFGYSGDEVRGHWFGEYLAPNSAGPFIAYFTKFRLSPVTESIVLEVVRRNGTPATVHLKGSIAVDQRGLFEMTQCVLEGGLQLAAPAVPIRGPWLLVSPEGDIRGATPAVEVLLGFPVVRLCGMRFGELCESAQDAEDALARLATHGALDPQPAKLRHAGGDPVEVTMSGFLMYGEGGMAGSYCISFQKA